MSCTKKNLYCKSILAVALSLLSIQAFNFLFSGNAKFCVNSVCIEKIDDSHAKLHCDSVKTPDGNFLFSKAKTSDGFRYDISDMSGSQKFYAFNSSTDIILDEGISNNTSLCGAIWNAIQDPSGGNKLIAVGTAAGAGAAAAPLVGHIVAAGVQTAATLGSFSAGAGVVAATAVAAAPVTAVVGAVAGAAVLG